MPPDTSHTLIIPTPFGDAAASYTLAGDSLLRPEIITVTATVEPPLIVLATVTYTDDTVGDIARISTLPGLIHPFVISSAVAFTFGIDLPAAPDSILRTTAAPGAESVFDPITFTQGLPDTVLRMPQSIGIELSASNPDGTAGTISIATVSIWAAVIDTSEIADVVPPYTPESYLLQSQAAAA